MMKLPRGMGSKFPLPRPIFSQYNLPKPTSKPPFPSPMNFISINTIPPSSSSSSIRPSSSSSDSLSPFSTSLRKGEGEGAINVATTATSNNNYYYNSSGGNNVVLTSGEEEDEEEEEEGGFILVTKRVVGAMFGVGLIVVVMGGVGDGEKAWAVGPQGPLMEEFWENMRRYGVYFLTVSTGAIYAVFRPIAELLKSPVSAILVLAIMAGSFYVVSQVLSAMTGLSGFSYDYGY